MASVATADLPVASLLEGTLLFHVYDESFTGPLDFNPVLVENGKPFDGARYSGTLADPADKGFHPYSSYYVGWSREVAIREAVIRDRARPHFTLPGSFTFARDLLSNRTIATVKVTRELALVDVRGRKNQDLCDVDRHVMHGTDYDETRKIALKLRHGMASKTCGMQWMSDQDEHESSAVLTGRPFVPWKMPSMTGVTGDWYNLSAAAHTAALDAVDEAWADGSLELLDTESLLSDLGLKYVMRSFSGPTYLI